MDIININQKFSLFEDRWHPKIIAELNGQYVKLAKLKGEFIWHNHEHEDELFYIVKGNLTIEFKDEIKEFHEGEMLVIPKGVDHRPIALEEVWVMLFEPVDTKHTGDITSELTVTELEKI